MASSVVDTDIDEDTVMDFAMFSVLEEVGEDVEVTSTHPETHPVPQ